MSKNKPSLPKGTRDFGPEVSAKRNYIMDVIKRNFRRYGFSQLETPSMENLATLTGKYGDEGDQLLFKILNSGDFLSKATDEDYNAGSKQLTAKISEKGLRYDLTVPFARYVVMHQNEISFPFKRFQIQPVWRADRPQKGRYREFYQCDADIIGSRSNWNEVELTLLIQDVFQDLGLADVVIKVNHREILFTLATYAGLGNNKVGFCVEIDKLDKVGKGKVVEKLVEMGGDSQKISEIMELISSPVDTIDSLERIVSSIKAIDPDNVGIEEAAKYFRSVQGLRKSDVATELDLGLARGLSYYTGIIFEVKPTSVQMGSICGGGRYDDLTGIFGLPDISGVGISFGLDRIYDVLEELYLFPSEISQPLQALILHQDGDRSEQNFLHSQELVIEMRKQNINTELYPDPVKIQKQFKYADKINVPFVVVIGDEERESKSYTLKNMSSGEQQKHTLDELIKAVQG
ncbi:MAG: histidine--tRNA ligase [Cyclobacteriaceae bacterium]